MVASPGDVNAHSVKERADGTRIAAQPGDSAAEFSIQLRQPKMAPQRSDGYCTLTIVRKILRTLQEMPNDTAKKWSYWISFDACLVVVVGVGPQVLPILDTLQTIGFLAGERR